MNYGSTLLVSLGLMLYGSLLAANVVSEGRARIFFEYEATAEQQAIKNALRNSVEGFVKKHLSQKVLAKHWLVVNKQIFSNPQAFIHGHTLLNSYQEFSDRVVKVDVDVDQVKLKRFISSFSSTNRSVLRSFKTVVLLPKSQNKFFQEELPKNASKILEQKFLQANLYISEELLLGNVKTKQALRSLKETDLLVELDFVQMQPLSQSVQLHAKISIYQVNNKKNIIQNNHRESYSLSIAVGQPGRQEAVQEIVLNATKILANKAVYQVLNFYRQRNNRFTYTVIFTKVDNPTKNQLLTLLTGLEFYVEHKTIRNVTNVLSLHYTTTESINSFKKALLALARENNILLRPQLNTGKNRLVFDYGG